MEKKTALKGGCAAMAEYRNPVIAGFHPDPSVYRGGPGGRRAQDLVPEKNRQLVEGGERGALDVGLASSSGRLNFHNTA